MLFKKLSLFVFSVILFCVGGLLLSAPGDVENDYIPSEVLVKFTEEATEKQIDDCIRGIGARVLKRFDAALRNKNMHKFFSGKLFHLGLPELMSVEDAVKALNALPFVEYAEPNYIIKPLVRPNDLLYDLQYAHRKIASEDAWDIRTDAETAGGEDVIVAVLDSGFDLSHEDLADNIWTNPGETGGGKETNGVDDDGNGYVDDWRGWDFVDDDNDPSAVGDDHGTHCAGIIGAVGNNSRGVTGVCWSVELMLLRIMGGGGGTVADTIEAIQYAAWFGVPVTSNSYGFDIRVLSLEDAIEASGALFVAAAGNEARDNDQFGSYPASSPCENIVSVAASDKNDRLASFSQWGRHTVDIAAPGVDILSTVTGNDYAYMSGTSMATPFVAAAAALVLAEHPSLSIQELKQKLLASADRLADFTDKTVSEGRLNLLKALCSPVGTPALSDPGYSDYDGNYTIEWSAAANAVRYELQEGVLLASVSEGAEGGAEDWFQNGFYITDTVSNTGSYSFHSGNADSLRATLEYRKPILVLAGSEVRFYCRYDIEDNTDYAYLEVSEDGHIWQQLQEFTGTSTTWGEVVVDLSSFDGKTVFLRFRYYSDDNGVNQGGFWVDDITISGVEIMDWTTLTDTETSTSFDIVGNSEGKYYYRVRAFDAYDTYGLWSETVDIIVGLEITTDSLPGGRTGTAYSATLEASGGTPPYTWAITSGSLPDGLSLDSGTGEISGTPTTIGTFSFTVTVTDTASDTATESFSIEIVEQLQMLTTSLPPAMEGFSYSTTVEASGGVTPYTWAVTSGSLPDGLSLDSATGEISGTPTTVGTVSFTLTVTDAESFTDSRGFSIVVTERVRIVTDSLPSAYTGRAYSVTLEASGGTSPYSWSISSGALPDGLSLDSATGILSGKAEVAGTYEFVVRVSDKYGFFNWKTFSLTVKEKSTGGGCILSSISTGGGGWDGKDIIATLLPYILLISVLLILKIGRRGAEPVTA